MDYYDYVLKPINEKAATQISEWEYPRPYDVYNFKGKNNGYLLNRDIWGIEQFCLLSGENVAGQAA